MCPYTVQSGRNDNAQSVPHEYLHISLKGYLPPIIAKHHITDKTLSLTPKCPRHLTWRFPVQASFCSLSANWISITGWSAVHEKDWCVSAVLILNHLVIRIKLLSWQVKMKLGSWPGQVYCVIRIIVPTIKRGDKVCIVLLSKVKVMTSAEATWFLSQQVKMYLRSKSWHKIMILRWDMWFRFENSYRLYYSTIV